MREGLIIYLITGYVASSVYQINCVIEYEKDLEYVRQKFSVYSSHIDMKFDYLGTIVKGYLIMMFWPFALIKSLLI